MNDSSGNELIVTFKGFDFLDNELNEESEVRFLLDLETHIISKWQIWCVCSFFNYSVFCTVLFVVKSNYANSLVCWVLLVAFWHSKVFHISFLEIIWIINLKFLKKPKKKNTTIFLIQYIIHSEIFNTCLAFSKTTTVK